MLRVSLINEMYFSHLRRVYREDLVKQREVLIKRGFKTFKEEDMIREGDTIHFFERGEKISGFVDKFYYDLFLQISFKDYSYKKMSCNVLYAQGKKIASRVYIEKKALVVGEVDLYIRDYPNVFLHTRNMLIEKCMVLLSKKKL